VRKNPRVVGTSHVSGADPHGVRSRVRPSSVAQRKEGPMRYEPYVSAPSSGSTVRPLAAAFPTAFSLMWIVVGGKALTPAWKLKVRSAQPNG
jgi:hypothetical protein